MEINNSFKTYQTKDLYESAYLYAKGVPLTDLNWIGDKCFFVFQNTETSGKSLCEQLSQQFWFGECLISAKSYYQAITTLKNRIFQRQG